METHLGRGWHKEVVKIESKLTAFKRNAPGVLGSFLKGSMQSLAAAAKLL